MNIVGIAPDSTTIVLSWSPPPFEEQNGMIRHYIVNMTELETGNSLTHTSADTKITMFSLHPFYTYTITVVAVTVAEGPPSLPVMVQTLPDGELFSSTVQNIILF